MLLKTFWFAPEFLVEITLNISQSEEIYVNSHVKLQFVILDVTYCVGNDKMNDANVKI